MFSVWVRTKKSAWILYVSDIPTRERAQQYVTELRGRFTVEVRED